MSLDERVKTTRDLQLAQDALCRQPFLKNQPLWDIILFPNYKDNNGGGAVALRVHHVLTDGVGHVSLLSAIAGQDPPDPVQNHLKSKLFTM